MNSKRIVTTILIIWLALASFAGFYLVQTRWQSQSDQFNQELIPRQQEFKLKLILKCQEFSAYTTRDDWTYKSCLKELKLAEPETKQL